MKSIIAMATSISISEEMREKIRNLGKSGESYDDIIRRMYENTSSNLLMHYLYDESDSVSLHDALNEARKRYPKPPRVK